MLIAAIVFFAVLALAFVGGAFVCFNEDEAGWGVFCGLLWLVFNVIVVKLLDSFWHSHGSESGFFTTAVIVIVNVLVIAQSMDDPYWGLD